jgi:cell division protein DivIC
MWKKLKKNISKLPWWATNPFCIAIVMFVGWMLFIDDNHVLNQYRKHEELSALLEKKDFYVQQIKKTDKEYFELTTNPATQEKFAREHYWMKRDNEDVFVIVQEK